MKLFTRALVCLLFTGGLNLVHAPASAGCTKEVDLWTAEETCLSSASDVAEEKEKYPTSVWKADQICKDETPSPDGTCFNPQGCTTAAGVPGTQYTITRDAEYVATACLTAGEAGEVDDPPLRVLVEEAFKNLDWPKSEVIVQPRGGQTLVNLETIFYTTNSLPTSQTVTLIEKQVTIEATPVSYAWSFGDESSLTTASAGKPYPDHDVFHVYTSTDDVKVSVATTYSGRYKVGDGNWQNIEATRVIEGSDVTLEVLEAKPQLVLE